MLRMQKVTDYAIVVLAHLARQEAGRTLTTRALAEATEVPHPTVQKVLKQLGSRGLVTSHRGLCGGYALAKTPEDISAIDIIEAMEGPVSVTECSVRADVTCNDHDHCLVGPHWPRINRAIRAALAAVTLADLAQPTPTAVWRDPPFPTVPAGS